MKLEGGWRTFLKKGFSLPLPNLPSPSPKTFVCGRRSGFVLSNGPIGALPLVGRFKANTSSQNEQTYNYDLVSLEPIAFPLQMGNGKYMIKILENIQGKQYDVNDPEQNIELGVRVLKSIYDAVPDKDIAKIATLWNGTGLKEVNDYGARAKEYYKNKSWNNPLEMPKIKSKKGK